MRKLAVIFFALIPLQATAELSTLFASCDGWPYEGGSGKIEFYRNLSNFDAHSVMVRTDQLNGLYGSINMTSAEADDAWNPSRVTIERKKDPQNLYSSMKITLNKGKDLKTPYLVDGIEVAQLTCTALE